MQPGGKAPQAPSSEHLLADVRTAGCTAARWPPTVINDLLRTSCFPVIRISTMVIQCHHQDLVGNQFVDDRERKTRKQGSPSSAVEQRAAFGVREETLLNLLKLSVELSPEAR